MSDVSQPDIGGWVLRATTRSELELRQAVHTILLAIASDGELRSRMIMKGGILLAVRYESARFTKDIDFSSPETLKQIDPENLRKHLDVALPEAVDALSYDLDCRVQRCRVNPPNRPDATFPSIELGIGYAAKGSPKHKRLLKLESPSVVSIDYSLNETMAAVDVVTVGEGAEVKVYGIGDLVAEKFRSLLQQPIRNRFRRQDIYDLALLLDLPNIEREKSGILRSLLAKCRAREIEPEVDSLANPEVRRRAQVDYPTLRDEVTGDLPDFATSYERVMAFYRSLPWG